MGRKTRENEREGRGRRADDEDDEDKTESSNGGPVTLSAFDARPILFGGTIQFIDAFFPSSFPATTLQRGSTHQHQHRGPLS